MVKAAGDLSLQTRSHHLVSTRDCIIRLSGWKDADCRIVGPYAAATQAKFPNPIKRQFAWGLEIQG